MKQKKGQRTTRSLRKTIPLSFLRTGLVMLGLIMSAMTYSHSRNVTINLPEATVEAVFDAIQSQSRYTVAYGNSDVALKKKVNVQVQDRPVEEAVRQALAGQDVAFTVTGNHIVLAKQAPADDNRIRVTGQITGADGEELIGASISEKGSTNGTVSDLDGNYQLTVGAQSTLLVSYVGYTAMEVEVNGRSVVNITLSEDAHALSEVVVTALGIKREKKALGYSMEELRSDALLESREMNITNALSGKIAGLQVIKASGTGASSKIVLRGNNSLTGDNQPLIIIDGIPVNNFTSGSGDMWGNVDGTDFGNGLADINPEDIESMSVLKGGAAAALYGSRAGNGAILITTKSGRKTEGLGISVSSGLALQSIFLKPDLQNAFGQGQHGTFSPLERRSWGPVMGTEVTEWNGVTRALSPRNNIDNFFRTGVAATENVAIQQTVNKTDMYFSINRLDDKGMTPNVSLNKTSLLARLSTNLGNDDRWRLDVKANYINNRGKNRTVNGINEGNPFYTLFLLPRSLDIMDLKNPSVDPDTKRQIWFNGSTDSQENPWWITQHRRTTDTRNRLIGSASMSYAFTDWLSAELRAGTDYYTTTTSTKQDFGAKRYTNGTYSERSVTFFENNFSFLTTARKDNVIGNLGGFVTFGGNLMSQRENGMTVEVGELSVPGLFNINNGKGIALLNYLSTPQKINSLYGSLQLNWDAYLFLDATLRNDWSSTMSKKNRSYMYPSVSFSGVVSDMIGRLGGTMPQWFTFAKVRASYAEVGNSLPPFQTGNPYELSKDPNGHTVAYTKTTLYDPDVKSELIKNYEAGAELRFLRNRLGLDFAWYKKNATNQLLDIPMDPMSTGYNNKKINAGNIQNRGWELMLNGRIIETKDFNWSATANISANKSKIIALTPEVTEYNLLRRNDGQQGGSVQLETIQIVAKTNGGYGDIYGKKYLRNEAGQIIVDGSGLPLFTEENELIGNQNPDFLAGLSQSLNYKGFNLNFMIDGRFGGYLYSGTSSLLHQFGVAAKTVVNGKREDFVIPNTVHQDGSANTTAVSHENYWTRIIEGGGANLGLPEVFTYDATNIRLRYLSLGYEFDKKVLKKTPITRLGLSVTCNNVWMIYSKTPKIDPESVLGTDTNAIGLELASIPTNRTFTFNVNIAF
ncbi:MAG: SusC/RagA family TonB-linked outer membrane protein [Dysgonamonadaceae bacterium]|jgi:TonB-linked SusC/RagA family outer membrane protein|nr:SusC/RagA family TonB-linked outer membrane protein [Dysgonamonadaceae bacterium]